jgi:hypothetical protein
MKKKKFKVGDTVIGNDLADERYNHTKKGWQGVVDKIFTDNTFESDGYRLSSEYFDLLEPKPEPKVEPGVNYEIY